MQFTDFRELAPNLDLRDEPSFFSGGWVDEARKALAVDGAVIISGPIASEDAAEKALAFLDEELLDDAFWSTPRSKVKGKTMTATEYPSPRSIPLHSETAYMRSWPRLVAFHSLRVADEGGETTICDIDAISRDLRNVLEPFRKHGVAYVRTFRKGVDLSWQQAFQTENRQDIEKIARRLGMDLNWLPNDVLETSHTAQGTIEAEDGSALYFNQAHLFHPSALDAGVRAALEGVFGQRTPRKAFYGHGAEIEDDTLDHVRATLDRHQTKMRWRAGDVLILDNMRHLHGRLPFSGKRRLHVSLAKLVTNPVRTPLFNEGRETGPTTLKRVGLFNRLLKRS
jgi:Taurine catabolism dioxygenase TauD, TfdA family